MSVFSRILIIADIEGSSWCPDYRASSFMTPEWRRACLGMTLDVGTVVDRLFDSGVKEVTIHDFHRTGYNLIPSLINPRARLVLGYRQGPVPGVGAAPEAEAVMFLGMHAASGTNGFLAHTFTSRIQRLAINGQLVPEVAFFSAALGPWNIKPVFFSGCPVACQQARVFIPRIGTFAIDKSRSPASGEVDKWRSALADAAAASLHNNATVPYQPAGPFKASVTMRDGPASARKIARRWGYSHTGNTIFVASLHFNELYVKLIHLCYLTPGLVKILPVGLWLYRIKGLLGLAWVRRGLERPR